jgi:hypothetical protein
MGKMMKVFLVLIAVILGFGTTTDVGLALLINLGCIIFNTAADVGLALLISHGRSWVVMGTSVLVVGASVLQDQSKVGQQVQLLGKLEK